MMNTIEYRVDCQLLQYLHWENALGCRFPIGKTDQVRRAGLRWDVLCGAGLPVQPEQLQLLGEWCFWGGASALPQPHWPACVVTGAG